MNSFGSLQVESRKNSNHSLNRKLFDVKLSEGQTAKHDFMKDKSQQKQTMLMLIASLKTKIVQTQKQIASVKSSNQQLEQDVE